MGAHRYNFSYCEVLGCPNAISQKEIGESMALRTMGLMEKESYSDATCNEAVVRAWVDLVACAIGVRGSYPKRKGGKNLNTLALDACALFSLGRHQCQRRGYSGVNVEKVDMLFLFYLWRIVLPQYPLLVAGIQAGVRVSSCFFYFSSMFSRLFVVNNTWLNFGLATRRVKSKDHQPNTSIHGAKGWPICMNASKVEIFAFFILWLLVHLSQGGMRCRSLGKRLQTEDIILPEDTRL